MKLDKFSQTIIKWMVKFAITLRHVHRAGKLKPTNDYYEQNFTSLKPNLRANERQKDYNLNNLCEIDNEISKILQSKESIKNMSKNFNEIRENKPKFDHQKSPYKNLAKIYPMAAQIHKYSLIFNIYLLIKYGILCALNIELFDDYKYIDCILVGRYVLDGQTVSFARYLVLFIAFFNIIWRLEMYFKTDKYNLDTFEFMATDFDEIAAIEMKEVALEENDSSDNYISDSLNIYRNKQLKDKSSIVDWNNLSLSFEQIDRIKFNKQNKKWKKRRRPTESIESWLFVSKNLSLFALIAAIYSILASIGLFILQLPIHLTKIGFILTQDHCVEWIIRSYKQSELHGYNSLNYMQKFSFTYIYQPNSSNFNITDDMKSILLKFEDFSELNLYHIIRIFLGLAETWICIFELGTYFSSGMLLPLLSVRQIRFYIHFIKLRLEALKIILREINLLQSISSSYKITTLAELEFKKLSCGKKLPITNYDYNYIELYAQQLQCMMIDLFRNICATNVMISDFTIGYLYMWIGYSAIAASWIFQPGPFLYTSKLECYLIHAFATFYMCLLVGITSQARQESGQLYKLSSSCMTLTNECLFSKTRWQAIMRFYYPRPLNCFTIFQDSQLTWFLALKLVAWLFSVLFVASTFFTYYQ